MNGLFRRFAHACANYMGSSWTFTVAAIACVIWAISGPFFHFSDTWQLVINTVTTVLTFLAVFLIQNTQNRNDLALQLKLDELLRAVATARTGLVDLENATDEELKRLKIEFERLHARTAAKIDRNAKRR